MEERMQCKGVEMRERAGERQWVKGGFLSESYLQLVRMLMKLSSVDMMMQ